MHFKVLKFFTGVIGARATIAVLHPATRGQLFYRYFKTLSEGVAIRSVHLTYHRVIILSAAFLGFRAEPHGAFVDAKVWGGFIPMCLSKKHILFISCSSVISAASPHSIMSSQEAESPTTG